MKNKPQQPFNDEELEKFIQKAEIVHDAVKKIADSKEDPNSNPLNEKYRNFDKVAEDLELREKLEQISLKDKVNPETRKFMDEVEQQTQGTRMEALQKIRNFKEDGNNFLKKCQYQQAKDSYESALSLIDFASTEGFRFFSKKSQKSKNHSFFQQIPLKS